MRHPEEIMEDTVSVIQYIIREELSKLRIAELGVVTSVFPHSGDSDKDNYECDVRLKNSGLELKKVPIATQRMGTVGIPNKEDLVLLTFDKGDINLPIVIGRLYNDEDRPPLSNPDEVIFRLPLAESDEKTVKMEVRNLSEKRPPREVLIELLPKVKVRIVDAEIDIFVDKTKLTLKQEGGSDGTITLESGTSRIVVNQDGDVSVDCAKNVNIEAKSDISIKGTNIDINGSGVVNIKGSTINLN